MKTLFAVAALSILGSPQQPSQADIDRDLDDLNSRLSQERVVPVFENGKPVGHKIVRPGEGVYNNLEIKNGDTISAPTTSEPNAEAHEAGEAKQ